MISTGNDIAVTIDPICDIVSGNFKLPETGERVVCPIQTLMIAPSLDGCERELLRELNFPPSLAIVCDAHTYDVLGRRVARALPGAEVTVLNAPESDDATVDQLAEHTRHAEALVAVGSGTLNDLVKALSHRRQLPYAVFATAPSMNGYVTATASISCGGEKLSLPAIPPKGAFFDLEILANAPSRLIRAGVGDCLCRSTAECDWRLSHLLFDTAFLNTPFDIQAADEAKLINNISGLEKGDLAVVESLTRLLILGGLGMMIAGSSQPGSQGEHLISHYIDMVHHPHPGSLHGEQVGLATRTMAGLQQHILARDEAPVLTETTIVAAELKARLGRFSSSCESALAKKALAGERLNALNYRLSKHWPAICSDLKARMPTLATLEIALDVASVAADPQDLGITPDFYREAVLHARDLRDRFTMLDLAADARILSSFVERNAARG